MHHHWTAQVAERARRTAPALAAAAMLVALVSPRGAVVALVLLVAATALPGLQPRMPGSLRLPAAVIALLSFGFYLAVNAGWSLDRGEAYGKVLFYFFGLALLLAGLAGVTRLTRQGLDRLGLAMLVALAIALLYLVVEVLLDQPIGRLATTWLPFLRPDPKHARVSDGRVVAIADYILNRNLAVLCLLLFPSLLVVRALLPRTAARVVAVGLVVAAAMAVSNSAHETSMLALLFALMAFTGMWLAPVVMRRLILSGWIVATVLVVPIALAAYAAGLHQAGWLPETGRNRIILWGFTAKEVRNAPMLGVGVASTREIDAKAAPTAARPEGHSYALRTGRHSHNVFIQAWFELGAVGAALLLAAGMAVLDLLRRLPRSQLPYAYATFVSGVVIGCFSWGLWQTWFMAAYCLAALVLAVALELAERQERDAAPTTAAR